MAQMCVRRGAARGRKGWVAGAVAGACLALLAGVAEARTLRFASQGDIATLDPYAHTESFTSNILHHIYEPLVRRSKSLEIEPALATAWRQVAPDRWRFELRRGVQFHNGNAFTADDVVASMQRLMDPAARARGNVSQVTAVEKVDDFTVEFVTRGPYPLLLNDLTGVFIMDREWMAANNALQPGNISTRTTTYASTNANGTGPFRFESWRPDQALTMTVNPSWWDRAEHNLTRIEFRPIRSDATRVAALLSGELDLIVPAPLQDLERIASASGYKVIEEPSLRLIFLGFSFRPELHAAPGVRNPLLDPRVRRALWMAIDLDTLHRRVMRGKSRTVGTLVAPQIPGYARELDQPLRFDPQGAQRLLQEAGATGFKVRLNCSNDRYIADEQTCVAIAGMWSRIGVGVEVQVESRTTYFPRMDRGELDIYMLGWATLPPMDAFSVLSALLATRGQGLGGNNPNGLSDPRLDALTAQAAVEMDEPKRRALMTEALKIVRDDVLYLPLHQQPVAFAARAPVEVINHADEFVRLWFAKVN
ncbi:MAG: ABC transporter substrate-binding protein [Alphaproteobacteria bacterium]|nr:ABC transporter substrate-binding protein [Alphaproteobacteria bacterium]